MSAPVAAHAEVRSLPSSTHVIVVDTGIQDSHHGVQ